MPEVGQFHRRSCKSFSARRPDGAVRKKLCDPISFGRVRRARANRTSLVMPNRHSQRHGWTHSKARAAAFALLPEYSMCVRGRHVMWKWAKDKYGKSALHYDHADDNSGYIGFSCAAHNCADGARKWNAQRRSGRHRARQVGYSPPDGGPGPGW